MTQKNHKAHPMTPDELRDNIAYAIIDAFKQQAGWNVICADAVLKAIEDAGCVVVPKESTEEMLKSGASHLHHKPSICDYMTAYSIFGAMISASPFKREEE